MTLGARRLAAIVLLSALAVVGYVTNDMMDAEEAAGVAGGQASGKPLIDNALASGETGSRFAAPSAPIHATRVTHSERIHNYATVTPYMLCPKLQNRRWLRLAIAQQADGAAWSIQCAY